MEAIARIRRVAIDDDWTIGFALLLLGCMVAILALIAVVAGGLFMSLAIYLAWAFRPLAFIHHTIFGMSWVSVPFVGDVAMSAIILGILLTAAYFSSRKDLWTLGAYPFAVLYDFWHDWKRGHQEDWWVVAVLVLLAMSELAAPGLYRWWWWTGVLALVLYVAPPAICYSLDYLYPDPGD